MSRKLRSIKRQLDALRATATPSCQFILMYDDIMRVTIGFLNARVRLVCRKFRDWYDADAAPQQVIKYLSGCRHEIYNNVTHLRTVHYNAFAYHATRAQYKCYMYLYNMCVRSGSGNVQRFSSYDVYVYSVLQAVLQTNGYHYAPYNHEFLIFLTRVRWEMIDARTITDPNLAPDSNLVEFTGTWPHHWTHPDNAKSRLIVGAYMVWALADLDIDDSLLATTRQMRTELPPVDPLYADDCAQAYREIIRNARSDMICHRMCALYGTMGSTLDLCIELTLNNMKISLKEYRRRKLSR